MARWFNFNRNGSKSPIQQAKEDWYKRNEQVFASNDLLPKNVVVSGLPDEYNNVPFRSVVNGVNVRTVGEYKAECAKHKNWY